MTFLPDNSHILPDATVRVQTIDGEVIPPVKERLLPPYSRWLPLLESGKYAEAIGDLVNDYQLASLADLCRLFGSTIPFGGDYALRTTGNRVLAHGSKELCAAILTALQSGTVVMVPTKKNLKRTAYLRAPNTEAEFFAAGRHRRSVDPADLCISEISK